MTRHRSRYHRAFAAVTLIAGALLTLTMARDCAAGDPAARRKVIIDQDAFGPAGSNMQAILMLLQARDV